MIIQGAIPASPTPAPTLKSMFDAVLSNTQQSQTQQVSTIVNLSTKGQSLSRASALLVPAPASSTAISSAAPSATTSTSSPAQMHDETNETSGQEINETGSIRFAEGEKSGQITSSGAATTSQERAAQLAQYTAGAVQNFKRVSIFA